jgi:hypothetical protein
LVAAIFLGGGGVWFDAHLRFAQNFALKPHPTTPQKKWTVAITKEVVWGELMGVFGWAKF